MVKKRRLLFWFAGLVAMAAACAWWLRPTLLDSIEDGFSKNSGSEGSWAEVTAPGDGTLLWLMNYGSEGGADLLQGDQGWDIRRQVGKYSGSDHDSCMVFLIVDGKIRDRHDTAYGTTGRMLKFRKGDRIYLSVHQDPKAYYLNEARILAPGESH